MNIKTIVETAKDTDRRLSPVSAEERLVQNPKHLSCIITIDPHTNYQTFQGFGGALTESAAFVLASLSPEQRQTVLHAYFDQKQGLGYTLARTHLNSCDFSLGNWACVERPDAQLASFSMEMPDRYQIPLIHDAMNVVRDTASPGTAAVGIGALQAGGTAVAGRSLVSQASGASAVNSPAPSEPSVSDGTLKLMVSPWSPPGWMKDTGEMNHGGKLLKQYYPLWAAYFVRFIKELADRGIPVWAVSVQNEPEARQIWDSCLWTAGEEAEFAIEHLGPQLERAGLGHIAILIWDHNRDRLWARAHESFSYPGAERYIRGAAYHWYSGDQYNQVAQVAQAYPDKLLVFSEGCVEGGSRPGAWFTGERYAHNIINDLNHGCHAWIDWNIALDMTGGPNHVGNLCDAPVLVDTATQQAHFQSSFYYIGHFSRYIRPGAVRLGIGMDSWMVPAAVDGRMGTTMEACAFRNVDGTISLVVCNRTEADMVYRLRLSGESEELHLVCPPRGIQTLML
ncbi:MAG: glycoside hydrolase family 30 beta sandwich domain-containing protein [Termitinemataceae bacterium]